MATAEERIGAYATALFEVARVEGHLERVEAELFEVARAFERNEELRSKLTDQSIPAELRQQVVEELLSGRNAQAVTTALVSFVVGTGRARELPQIIDAMVRRSAAERDEEVAEVRAAIPLDDDQQRRLAEALSRRTGKKITLHVTVDPSVMGGVVTTIGDTVIDGSVRHRIDQLRESL